MERKDRVLFIVFLYLNAEWALGKDHRTANEATVVVV
jgi:hypothetical protein